jgi:hypothetical protein
MRLTPWKNLAAAAAAVVVTGATLAGIEQRALPAFEVVNAAGEATPSAMMGPGGRWLLVYVTPECRSCQRLFTAMEDWNSAPLAAATVVLVQGDHASASRYAADRLPASVVGTRWFADAAGAGRQALKLTGSPVIIGMQDQQIRWALAGVLNDPAALESALRTWVEQP